MKPEIKRALFLPVIMMLGIVPLMVRLRVGVLSGESAKLFRKVEYVEFYSQSKAIVIVGVAALMLILMFFIYDKAYLKKSKIIMVYIVAAVIFVIFTGISTAQSEYTDIALWGVYDRAEGLYIWVCYIIMMFYVVYIFSDVKEYKYIIIGLSVVVIIATIIGSTQYIGKDILLSKVGKQIIVPNNYAEIREIITAQFSNKMMTATMYNPNYVGSFAVMMLPIFTLLVFYTKDLKKRIFYIVITLCSLILLIGSSSSAGLVGAVVALLLALVIFRKPIIQELQTNRVIVLLIIGVLILGAGATSKLWYPEVKSIVSQGITLLTPTDKSADFKDHLILRDIYAEEGKVIIIMQDEHIQITYENDEFVFYDKQNAKINYSVTEDFFVTEDERFRDYYFKIFYVMEKKDLMGGLALLHDDQRASDSRAIPLFFMKYDPIIGVFMMDSDTQEKIEIEHAEAIGFRGKEKLGSGRGYIWSRTVPMLKHTLLIGHGPDTYAFKFPQMDSLGKWYGLGNIEILVDKPHNLYLQIGVNQGLIALLCFLALVGTYVVHSCMIYRAKQYHENHEVLGIATLLAVVGYLVAGLFNDSTVSVAPIFWILLGTGIAINYIVTYKKEVKQII